MNQPPDKWGESPLREVYNNWLLVEFTLTPLSTWETTIEREENECKRQMPICPTARIPATVETPNAL